MPRQSVSPYQQLRFPVGGINKRVAYQWQPPYTTGNCSNVIPDDSLAGRERGGSRPGLTQYSAAIAVAPPRLVNELRYITGGVLKSLTVVAMNGALYGDNGSGTFTSKGSLTTDRPMQGASYLQKFFLSGGTLKVYDPVAASFGSVTGDNTLLEPTSYGAYAAGSVTIVAGVVTLDADSATENPIWPAWAGVSGTLKIAGNSYKVSTRDSNTQLTLVDTTVAAAAGSLFFLQSRGPVSYADEGGTAPAAPTNCFLVQRWSNRLVVAGDTTNPLAWYMSAQGNPSDWRYALTNDPGAAVSGTAMPGSGALGDSITALIPHNDSCLIFGMRGSLSVLRGNPAAGGTIELLSDSVGVLTAHSWCYDDEGFQWFMSNKGLYVMPPGCGSTPTAVSAHSIPKDLSGLDPAAYYVSLAYDGRFRGLHIVITKISDNTAQHYFVATKTTLGGATGGQGLAAFFPITYDATPNLVFTRPYFAGGSTQSPVLIFTLAGTVNYWDTGTPCEKASSVDMGPFPLAAPGLIGLLTEVDVVIASGSGAVTAAVRHGESPEAAQAASSFETHTLAAGLNSKFRPRMGNAAGVLNLSAVAGVQWAIEDVTIAREAGGPRLIG